MKPARNINFFLIDGEPSKRVKCTMANWTGITYKIPSIMLKESKSIKELKFSGIYFLFGEDEESGSPLVYIGQAIKRKNGKGILNRLVEHRNKEDGDWWNMAVVFTTAVNTFGPTELNYLEHHFYRMAIEAGRYKLRNGNDPNPGNLTEEKESEVREFIEYAKLLMGVFGFKVFEPMRPVPENSSDQTDSGTEPILYLQKDGADASGQNRTGEFILFKGSKVVCGDLDKFYSTARKSRMLHAEKINSDGIVLKDISFNTPTGASDFVLGKHQSGKLAWKNRDGLSLQNMEKNQSKE